MTGCGRRHCITAKLSPRRSASPKTLGQFPLRPTGVQRRVLALLGQNSLRLRTTEPFLGACGVMKRPFVIDHG